MVTLKPLSEITRPVDPRVPSELLSLGSARHPWTVFVALSLEGNTVGACAFKSAPNKDKEVEIAYVTFADLKGRGLGTAMAQCLVDIATRSGEVNRVVARTLKVENASVRICRRLNFDFLGEVIDPDDGSVWAWKKQIGQPKRRT